MPRIKLIGVARMFKDINDRLNIINGSLPAKYEEAVEEASAKIISDAKSALSKPNWLLSKSITAGSTKLYRGGRFIFKVVEMTGSKNPAPNTPGFYGWYQEHGYHVDPKTVRRPRAGRLTERTSRSAVTGFKRRAVTGYRRQEGKHFFQSAILANVNLLQEKIEEINRWIAVERWQ